MLLSSFEQQSISFICDALKQGPASKVSIHKKSHWGNDALLLHKQWKLEFQSGALGWRFSVCGCHRRLNGTESTAEKENLHAALSYGRRSCLS